MQQTWYKPGRSMLANMTEGAVEALRKDGWSEIDPDAPGPPAKKRKSKKGKTD